MELFIIFFKINKIIWYKFNNKNNYILILYNENSSINDCPYLKTKIINFASPLEKCNFLNTNIECYQPGTCIKFGEPNSKPESEMDEDQNMGNNLR